MKAITAAMAIGAVALAASPALADRDPTPQERGEIERLLRTNGFVSWEEIELDDDGPYWEVDDARTATDAKAGNGRKYDLKISADRKRIVKRSIDD